MSEKKIESPLAERMRPERLADFSGQEEIIGEDGYLRFAIEKDQVSSCIFWGPPGSGKTTLARIIAKETHSRFIPLLAVSSGVKELRAAIKEAEEDRKKGKRTILFIDEIHRWSKAQQDALLPHVERGLVILIGATTENPSFEVNAALLSRSRVVVLRRLEKEDLEKILMRALKDKEEGLGKMDLRVEKGIIGKIAAFSNGDARTALNILEAASKQSKNLDDLTIKKVLQKSNLFYDKDGEEHYNIISALHKSMRGGDENASIYWLSRMIDSGEDPLYIARRLLRFASEDVGLADSSALVLANSVFDACHKLGYPECEVHLAQLVVYLSRAEKSVAAYLALGKAKKDVEMFGSLPVPHHLRNAPTKLMERLGYGKGYRYTPLEDSSSQEYFPRELKDKKYL